MKLKNKVKPKSNVTQSVGTTEMFQIKPGLIQIHHHQSVRLSENYQSAECGYGMTCVVPDTDESIAKTVKRLEEGVEGCLTEKIAEQKDLLKALGNVRGQ